MRAWRDVQQLEHRISICKGWCSWLLIGCQKQWLKNASLTSLANHTLAEPSKTDFWVSIHYTTWPFRVSNNFHHFSIDFSVNVTSSGENLQINARFVFQHTCWFMNTTFQSDFLSPKSQKPATNASLSINKSRFPMLVVLGNFHSFLMSQSWLDLVPTKVHCSKTY